MGFYTCNATNALGYDSVSIAVTLAGNVEILVQFNSETIIGWVPPMCQAGPGTHRQIRSMPCLQEAYNL